MSRKRWVNVKEKQRALEGRHKAGGCAQSPMWIVMVHQHKTN